MATEIDNLGVTDSYADNSLHEQSHGEAFWSVMQNRFRGNGLYLLDEPEAALSPSRQMAMLIRMNELARNNSQFIIATHSPILIAFPDALIYEFSDEGIQTRKFDETKLVQTYQGFFNDPQYMVHRLLR